MGLYAEIDPNGNVVNMVQWDGVTPYNVVPNTLVSATGQPNAQVGGTYLNGTFTPPAAPVSPQGIVYQNSPVSGASLNLPKAVALNGGYGKLWVYLQPAAALAALTMGLPPNPSDGDEMYVVSTKNITAVTITPSPGQTLLNFSSPFALTAGVAQHITYSQQLAGWFHL